MSDLRSIRILNHLINVRNRLESLLVICRIEERPCWSNDDESNEFDRFHGPYRSDIEELENSILDVSKLIENLRHETSTDIDIQSPLPNYPLCKNQWTIERIEHINDELNLETLQLLRLQILSECLNPFDNERRQVPQHPHDHTLNRSSLSTVNEENKSSINLLDFPIEILLHIFSYLSPCELISHVAPTCRYFARLILSRCCLNLNLTKLNSMTDIPAMLKHLSSLQSLTLIDWENDVSYLSWSVLFDVIVNTTNSLRKIRFRNVLICPVLVGLIVEYFPHCLETIVFDGQQNKTYEKFDLVLSLLANDQSHLQRLTASYQTGITNFGIKQFVSKLPVIKELNLVYVEAIQDETVNILCNKHKDHLEILKIDGAQLTDRSLDYISKCHELKVILVEFCTNLTGLNFSNFQRFAQLTELNLCKLNDIPAECFQYLFDKRNHRFEHLSVLKLGECHAVNDICIECMINTCPSLKELTCSWAYGVTDVGFSAIVRHCQHLEYVSLIGCYLISGEALVDVPHKYLKSIKELNFEQCNQISDDILLELYRRKKNLLIINYYGSLVEDEEDEL